MLLFGSVVLAAPAAAQDEEEDRPEPPTFTLPQQRPATGDDVQGPVDERAGVPIPPRLIRPAEQAEEQKTPDAQPAETGAPAQPAQEPVETLFDDLLSTRSPTTQDLAQPDSQDAATGSLETPTDQGGAVEGTEAEQTTANEDWVDLPTSEIAPAPSIDLGSRTAAPSVTESDRADTEAPGVPWQWLAALAALIAIGVAGWFAWRASTPRQLLLESNVASTAREHLAATSGRDERRRPPQTSADQVRPGVPPAQPSSPPPAPANPPRQLDLDLVITSATRSVMTFALGYRLTIANRSDKAARDLSIMSELTSAVRGQSNAPSLGKARPLATVDRVGPQQAHTLTGTLELPMLDVRMLRQGSTPVFIPLLHLTIEGAGQKARSSSFVIGVPSAANPTKLHPVALDRSPGTVHNLRANLVRARAKREPA